MKKENGITIVALSVTIIVLLILAGISIKLVLDNNGIIGNAQTAKNQYIEAEANTEQGIGELSNALSSSLNHNRNNGTNTTTNTVNPTPTPEPTKYSLTINAGAGTTTGSTNVQGTSGSTVTVSTPTPPSGYTVILNGNDGVIGTSSTASFKTTYSFSRWNLSGGGSISGTTYTFGNSNGTLTAQYTHTGRSLPTATRSGYTFKGWYTTATGGTKVGDAGTVYTPTSNVTIYAQWEKNVITSKVTLNVGAGTANSDTSFQGNSGTSITITNPTAPSSYTVYLENNDGSYSSTSARSTFKFSGWSLSGGGSISGSTYTFGDTDGTLTAQYTQIGITLTRPTRTGYTLKGWYTASSGGTKVGNGGDVYKPSANGTTIYAQWEQVASVPDLTSSNTTFRASTTNWTNEYVTVNVSTTVSGYTLQTTTGNPTVESNWANTSYVTATSNCTVYARLTNGSTSGNYTSYNVTNIDKTKPDAIGKGRLTISVDKAKNQGYLQMNSIYDQGDSGQTASGVARIDGYYRFEGESTATFISSYTYATINGSKVGMSGGSCRFTASSSKITSSATGTLYMYAIVYDVAGNYQRSWTASINLSTGSTNYQEEVVSYSPIITQDTYSATDGTVMVTARSPQSGYTVQITMEDPTVEENWEDISSIGVYENTTVYARLKSGSTTYSYSTYNVTNINSYDYTSGRGRNTLAVDKSVNKFFYQLNSIPAGTGTAKTQTFKMYYRVKGSNGYQLKEVQESVSSGGSLRLTVEDSNLMNKKVFVYVVIINSDGTRTLVKEAWIDSSVSPWKTYYAEA